IPCWRRKGRNTSEETSAFRTLAASSSKDSISLRISDGMDAGSVVWVLVGIGMTRTPQSLIKCDTSEHVARRGPGSACTDRRASSCLTFQEWNPGLPPIRSESRIHETLRTSRRWSQFYFHGRDASWQSVPLPPGSSRPAQFHLPAWLTDSPHGFPVSFQPGRRSEVSEGCAPRT